MFYSSLQYTVNKVCFFKLNFNVYLYFYVNELYTIFVIL